MPGSARGAIAWLSLSGLALLVAGALAAMSIEVPLSPAAAAVAIGAALVGIVVLLLELRRDPRDAGPFVAIAGTVTFFVAGAIWWFGHAPHPIAGGLALLGAALLLGTVAWMARDPAWPDPARYALASRFGAREVTETDGVQFVVAPGDDRGARRDRLEVWVQNTFDARREVEVHVDLPLGSGLRAPEPPRVQLGPAESGVVTLPIHARPGHAGRHPARVWISARGGGRRALPWRARQVERPPRGIFRALGVVAAAWHPLHARSYLGLGAGVRVELGAVPERSDVAPAPRGSFRRVAPTPPREAGADPKEALLADRIVFLGGPIDEEVAHEVIDGLRLLRERDATADVTLYIDSPGGAVDAATRILDEMGARSLRVSTLCVRQAHGVAAVLLAAGTPGLRFAVADAIIGLSPVSGRGDTAPATAALVDRLVASTGRPRSALERALSEGRRLDAEGAREMGLVDGVFPPRRR